MPVTAAPSRAGLRASVATSLAGKAVEMVTLVLLATVVPRALGPHDYGRFAVPLTLVTLGSLAMTLGGPTLMARFVPAAPPAERVALARAVGGRLARGRAVQVAAIAAVALAASVAAPDRVPPLETVLVVAALALNVAASVGLQVGLGLSRPGPWSARYPLQNAVLVVAVLALHAAAGPVGAVAALAVSALAACGLAAVVVAPVWRAQVVPVPVPPGAIRFGALHAAGAALVQAAHRGGVVAVALLAGSTVQAGYAALAVGVALGATYAVLQAFTVALPHLSGPTAGPSAVPEAERVLRRLAGGLLAVLAPACVLGVVLADPLVPAVAGARYGDAAGAFGPALAAVVLAPLSSLLVQAAALRLQPGAALATGVASAAGFLVGAAALVPSHGATGGTAATLVGVVAGVLVAVRRLPGAAGGRLVAASLLAVAAVLGAGAR